MPGKAGLHKPSLDTSEDATATTTVAPKLVAGMIGDHNDANAELCVLERQAVTALEARDLMQASKFYMDLIKKIESLDDEASYWMRLAKAHVAMSRTRQRLGSVIEAQEWISSALELVQTHQVIVLKSQLATEYTIQNDYRTGF